jgi:hypothetical protein
MIIYPERAGTHYPGRRWSIATAVPPHTMIDTMMPVIKRALGIG